MYNKKIISDYFHYFGNGFIYLKSINIPQVY